MQSAMSIELTPVEARILGCLIEKAITTPDQYPLSLNALTNACNQKSNRHPVMELDEHAVQQSLDALVHKHLVLDRSGFGSRVPKYQHRFCNTGFGSLELSALELAILCELLIRGPQTPGELRTRTARMAEVKEVNEVEAALNHLASRQDGPFVVALPREPNRREARFAHLLSGAVDMQQLSHNSTPEESPAHSLQARIEQLEQQVTELTQEMAVLKKQLTGSDSV